MGKIRSDLGRETAENLCLGFGCWGKGFFAKVSDSVKYPSLATWVKAGLPTTNEEKFKRELRNLFNQTPELTR